MKEFLNTLMMSNWVECEDYFAQVHPGMLRDLYYPTEDTPKPVKPICLDQAMFERNGFKIVTSVTGRDDVYIKRVQEGPNNDEYDISVHFHDDNVTQLWVLKVINECDDGVDHELMGLLCNVKYVHTFQNLLNITGLKETSEEFCVI